MTSATYDVLIVDEAQDLLLADYVDVFDALLDGGWGKGRWRVFLDPHQDLFGAKSTRGADRLQYPDTTLFRLSCELQKHAPNRYDIGPYGRLRTRRT